MAAAAVTASSFLAAREASATTYVWNGNGTADPNWSTASNWTPAGPPAATADVVTFDNTGVAALANTVDPALTGTQFTQLLYRPDGGTSNTYTTSIDRSLNLNLQGFSGTNGGVALTNSSLVVMPTTTPNAANAQTGVNVVFKSTGIGTSGGLKINSGNVIISGRPRIASDAVTTNVQYDSYALVDMTGLDSFAYTQNGLNNSTFTIGAGFEGGSADNGAQSARLLLSPDSSFNMNRLVIGSQNNPITAGTGIPANVVGMQPVATLMLNASTKFSQTLTFGNIYVAADPTSNLSRDGSGAVMFMKNVTNPTAFIGLPASRNTIDIGVETALQSHNAYGVWDGTSASGNAEGNFDGYLSRVRIGGLSQGTSGSGGGFGMLSIDKGTLNIDATFITNNTTAIQLGYSQAANTGTGSPGEGILNVGVKGFGSNDLGNGIINAVGNIIVGQRTHATNNGANGIGIVNLANNGSITADRIFIGNNTPTAASNGTAMGIVNLTGGTLTTRQIHAGSDVAQTGTTTRLMNFNGGKLVVKADTTFAGTFMEGLTAATVHQGSGTIDTNGVDTVINQPLVAPTGQGISAINITDGGSKYRAAPIVMISGGGGVGATAVASIDDSGGDGTGKVIGITVTNPGTGYDSSNPPTVALIANGGQTQAFQQIPFGGAAATTTLSFVTFAGNVGGGITKTGSGSLTLNGANTYTGPTAVNQGKLILGQSLTTSSAHTVTNGAITELPANGTQLKVIKTGPVSVTGTGSQINIQDNKLISTQVGAAGTWSGSDYTGITGLIASGRNTGNWDGTGIVTGQTNAIGSNYHSIGVATASDVRPATATATDLWAGQTITGTDTLVMYTYGGDATLDGKINIDDYVKIDSGIAGGYTGWVNGDFNYDGKVSIDDYITVIDANIGNQTGVFPTAAGGGADGGVSGVTAVPEPASVGVILGVGTLAAGSRRKRRRGE
jgi:autotransporter-associated beta strand protein